jgi:hypothetical protein
MLKRRAFSRTAILGQLYDANTDTLLPSNILKLNEIPQEVITENGNEFIEHNFLYADSTDDQFKHLDIDSSMRLSLYAGLVEVGGSGKYLTNIKSHKNSIKGSFYYKLVKKNDELLIENIPFQHFQFDVLKHEFSSKATHVIIRRQYGSDLFFTFESKSGNKEILKKIESRLDTTFYQNNIELGIKYNSNHNIKEDDICVSFYGDAKPPSKYKGTIDSVLECLTEIDEMTKEPKQMIWELYPINILKKNFKDQLVINNHIEEEYDMVFDEEKSNVLFHAWDILLETKRQLDTLHKNITKEDELYMRQIIESIISYQNEISKRYKKEILEPIKLAKNNSIQEEQKKKKEEQQKKQNEEKEQKNSNKDKVIQYEKLDIDLIIKRINQLNDDIIKYLRSHKVLLPINPIIQNENNEIILNRYTIRPREIKLLKGVTHIYLTDQHYIRKDENEEFVDFIRNNKPTHFQHKYFYFCDITDKINHLEGNLIRYIRFIQMKTDIEPEQRWTHINSIHIFDIKGNEISLHNLYIRIKYSSKKLQYCNGSLLDKEDNTYFHTSNGLYEWIEIDLGTNMYISKVIIENRKDSGNPHDNPARAIGHELQAFAEYTLLGNKIMVASSEILRRELTYVFDFNAKGIISCKKESHISNFCELCKKNKVYTLWNSIILDNYKNTIMWNESEEDKSIIVKNDHFLTPLLMPCPHNLSEKIPNHWVCYKCNSQAKICKNNYIWYFNCYECNVAVKLEDCLFWCNNTDHGKEPFPCNKNIDFDMIKSDVMIGKYILDKWNKLLSIDIEDDDIIYQKKKKTVKESKIELVNLKEPHIIKNYNYFSPFTLYIPNNNNKEEYIILDIKNSQAIYTIYNPNYKYYKNKCRTLYIDNSYHLKVVIQALNKEFEEAILSNNQLRKSGLWTSKVNRRIIEFKDESFNQCIINNILVNYTMINPYTCVAEWKEPRKLFKRVRIYKSKKCFITIDIDLKQLFCIEITNNKLYSVKWYKIYKE